MTQVDMAQVVAKYQEVRRDKEALVAKHKEAIAPYDEALSRLDAWIQTRLREMNVKSVNTPAGTAVVSEIKRLRITSWDEALDFIREGERWEMLNKALSKNAVIEWQKENEKEFPGIQLDTVHTVSVRKPAAGSKT